MRWGRGSRVGDSEGGRAEQIHEDYALDTELHYRNDCVAVTGRRTKGNSPRLEGCDLCSFQFLPVLILVYFQYDSSFLFLYLFDDRLQDCSGTIGQFRILGKKAI